MEFVTLEELGGIISLLEEAGALEELEAILLLDGAGALLEDAGVLLEETGAVSSSFGTCPLKFS